MFGVGWTEILLVLLVALLFLGPTKLPDIARGLGKGLREFKRTMNSLDEDDEQKRAKHAADVPDSGPPACPTVSAPALPAGNPPSVGEESRERPV